VGTAAFGISLGCALVDWHKAGARKDWLVVLSHDGLITLLQAEAAGRLTGPEHTSA